MWFASDNAVPAHPAALAEIVRANSGPAASYGAEEGMARVTASLREIFEAPDAVVHLVATGTAANALALGCLCPPWATVFAHRTAHVAVDECGAPEFFTHGAKLTLLDGADGRIDAQALDRALAVTGAGGVHNVQPGALSLTNVTECGTVYTPADTAALARRAHGRRLPVHLDGARFANAVAALGCTPAEASWRAGVDVLSFGGTKNGLLGVEAVIFFHPAHTPGRSWEFELRRKRGGHLFSKHRFLSAQMEAYLRDGLWLDLAANANARAGQLAQGLGRLPGVRILYPTEANMVFAAWPEAGHHALQAAGAAYFPWPMDGAGGEAPGARLVCGWSTTTAEVDAFLGTLRGALSAAA